MVWNSLFQTFCFQEAIFYLYFFFQKLKQKYGLFIFITVDNTSRIYNLGHNILELYNILVQIRLTTSKTKCDI